MEFVLIATAHFLALLSPGPDFFLIVQAALRLPFRFGIAVCGGIAVANAVYLFCAVLGLEAVREMSLLMTVMRYCGGAYLVLLGIMLLRAPIQRVGQGDSTNFVQVRRYGRQFVIGFMSGILNPKNAIFYLSLFTVMVSPRTSLALRALYGLWMVSVVFVWDAMVVLLVGHERVRNRLGRAVFLVEKFSGVLLAVFGMLLPFT